MEHFAAEGGFRISAVRTAAGTIRDVRIHSTLGSECRLANPWPAHAVEIASADAAPAEIVEVTGQYLTFPTRQGGTYHVRPLP